MATTTMENVRPRRGWTTRDAVLVAVLAMVFGARRWQDYSLATVMLAGAAAMLVALPWNWYRLGYFQLNIGFLVVLLIVRLISGAVLSGLLAKVIGDALARAGVLSNFAIGRERQEVV